MMPSSGDSTEEEVTGSDAFAVPVRSKVDWTSQIDPDQVFRLIDGILPFEACLYHQVLPLRLEGSRLRLGMVNLDDSAALDYVRRIMAYMNCSLVPQTLASEVHHAVLSAYLNYTGTQKKPPANNHSQSIAKRIERKLAQETSRNRLDSDAPISPVEQDAKTTLLVDSPENLAENPPVPVSPPVVPTAAPVPESNSPPHASEPQGSIADTPETSTPDVDSPEKPKETLLLEPDALPPPPVLPEFPMPGEALPTLEVVAHHLSDPVEVLANLSPDVLLQELLARVLIGGIGRLYFERQPQHGRILWSQNGIPQSVLNHLPLPVMEGVINELKLMTRLPLIPVQKSRQVEIERIYQKQRLLLRLRVMPGNHGEEATLQVLRGAALKFHQQQQLANLSRDALEIANELYRKVDELRTRTRFYPMLTTEQTTILPALDKVLKDVEQQLEVLKAMQMNELPEDDSVS